jgi:hypothetical protein
MAVSLAHAVGETGKFPGMKNQWDWLFMAAITWSSY